MGAMLPPPPRSTKQTPAVKDDAPMTEEDMNSWLLNGPSADGDTGGWQYGTNLGQGAGAPLQQLISSAPTEAGAQGDATTTEKPAIRQPSGEE